MNKLFDINDLLYGKLYNNVMLDIICISETWLHSIIPDSIITIGRSYIIFVLVDLIIELKVVFFN